jgi:cyclopropane-fatty-acyl-phospholipid synthase
VTTAAPQRAPGVGGEPTNQHYDQSPRLFELFLDESLKYSAGRFLSGDETLHQAQLQKMDFVAEQLGARRGTTVLDVGCGWGSLTLHLASRHGCQVSGVTPSPSQAEYIRGKARQLGVADAVTIHVGTFDEVALGDRKFDAVTMLGSVTHMTDKAAAVQKATRHLRTGGRYYLSESCFRNRRVYDEFDSRPGTNFIRDDIFGWGELVPMSTFVIAFEDAGLSLAGLTDLTADYGRTIEHWRANAVANRAEIDQLEAGKTDQLLRYFDICNAGWGLTTKHYALLGLRRR